DLGIDVTAGRTGSTTGRAVVGLPERDALDRYLRGELELPVEQVVDAVERFGNGSLALDEVFAARLLDRYRAVARPAVAPGPSLAADPEFTVLPAYLHDGLGQTAIEQVTWRRGGATTQLFDEVAAAAEAAVPGALAHDPALRQTLVSAFAGKRWAGHVDALLERGFRLVTDVRVPGKRVGADRLERLDLRVRGRFAAQAVHLGFAKTVLQIIQDYGYGQRERSANHEGSTNAVLNGGAAGSAPDVHGSVSVGTGHGLGSSARVADTATRLDGTATFTGADRVGHELSVTVTARAPRRGREAVRELTGDLVRLIPSGLIDSTPGAAVTTDVPLAMPAEFSVESTRTPSLLATITEALRGLAGRAAVDEIVAADLEHLLAPNARSAFLRRALAPGGHLLATIPVGLRRHVRIGVRATATGGRVLVGGRSLELRTVNRHEDVAGSGRTDSRALPLTRGVGGGIDGAGLGGGASSGSAASHANSGAAGRRVEKTVYRAGTGATVEIGLRFAIDLDLVRTSRGGVDRTVRSITVHDTGTAFVTVFEPDQDRASTAP
ncbi:MAG: hypothetical protein L0H84_08300, partial [Pseudonocardia sp.]|nr:hypothetical protein [Pseudonocardia sp.]